MIMLGNLFSPVEVPEYPPISVTSSRVIQARVFQSPLLPGPIVMQTYNLIGTGFGGFSSSKLPILVINTSSRGIVADSRTTNISVMAFDTFRGMANLSGKPSWQGLAQMEIRGQTSAGFAKKPYGLELNDAFGQDEKVPLLGLPAESDWALRNPYSDKCLINDFLATELHEQMGHYATRRRLMEVFVDDNGGKLDWNTDYRGIYLLLEKIKVDAR